MKKARAAGSAGFTLLEVLVATAIAGIAVAALTAGLSGSLRNLGRAEGHEKALLIGRSQLNRLLIEEKLEPGRLEGAWDGEYRWVARITRWNPAEVDPRSAPPVMVVRLTVYWRTPAGEKQLLLETSKYVQQ